MLKIWGRTSSSNVMKLLWLCEELAIPHERVDAGGAFGVTREPFYLAMNPNARVPTIEDGEGFSLWESNAICRYLANSRAPGHAIYPAAARPRALVERWMDWQLANLNGPMTTVFFTYVRIPEAERDYAATAKARDEAEALWRMVETQLGANPYLCGEALTLADIALGPYLHRWFALPIARGEMPRLAAWYARLKAGHAGFRAHIAVPLA
ncbi:MAG: glutathione S-transferase family protein [Acetobacteraceae bacterium]|nr:glutathione S-transferase family protein [Acetobacteraceae bacterium]